MVAPAQVIELGRLTSIQELLKRFPPDSIDYITYPRGEGFMHGTFGRLVCSEISRPYTAVEAKRPGDIAATFTISGVIEEEGNRLAFKYDGRCQLPFPVVDDLEKRFLKSKDYVDSVVQAGYAKYLHLLAGLRGENQQVYLRGFLLNSSPPLFLPERIKIKKESFTTGHGPHWNCCQGEI